MHYTNAFIRSKKAPFRGVFKYKDRAGNEAALAMAPVKAPKIDTPLPNALDDGARRLLVTFLDNAPRTPFNPGVLLALSTGMREGEICGLRWSDVSFRTNTLWVRRSIARDNGSYYVKQPKTRGSIRDIPLTTKAVAWLKERKGAQEAELVVAGLSPTEERMGALYVLGGVDGSHMAPHTLSKGWKSIADSMGLVGTQGRRPTFHAWSVKQTRRWRVCSDKARALSERMPWPSSHCATPSLPTRYPRA